jgi:hypothetical protein
VWQYRLRRQPPGSNLMNGENSHSEVDVGHVPGFVWAMVFFFPSSRGKRPSGYLTVVYSVSSKCRFVVFSCVSSVYVLHVSSVYCVC